MIIKQGFLTQMFRAKYYRALSIANYIAKTEKEKQLVNIVDLLCQERYNDCLGFIETLKKQTIPHDIQVALEWLHLEVLIYQGEKKRATTVYERLVTEVATREQQFIACLYRVYMAKDFSGARKWLEKVGKIDKMVLLKEETEHRHKQMVGMEKAIQMGEQYDLLR